MVMSYTIIWLACSFGLCVFGFFLGRCARKLPIIDSRLPWTLSRDQVSCACQKEQEACKRMHDKPSWPGNPH
jgi:hypothetical protein